MSQVCSVASSATVVSLMSSPLAAASGSAVELTHMDGSSSWIKVEDFVAGPGARDMAEAASTGSRTTQETCNNAAAAAAGSATNDYITSAVNGGFTVAAAPVLATAAAGTGGGGMGNEGLGYGRMQLVQGLGSSSMITGFRIPLPVSPGTSYWSSKLTVHRHHNEHAAVNMAAWMETPPPQAAAAGDGAGAALTAGATEATGAAAGAEEAGPISAVAYEVINGTSSSSRGVKVRVAMGTYQPLSIDRYGNTYEDNGSSSSSGVVWRCSRVPAVEAAVEQMVRTHHHHQQQLQQQHQEVQSGVGVDDLLHDLVHGLPELLFQDISPAGRRAGYVR